MRIEAEGRGIVGPLEATVTVFEARVSCTGLPCALASRPRDIFIATALSRSFRRNLFIIIQISSARIGAIRGRQISETRGDLLCVRKNICTLPSKSIRTPAYLV